MLRALSVRLIDSVAVIAAVVTVVFFLSRVVGDPIRLLAPLDTPPGELAHLRHQAGLDQPLYQQYARYLSHVVRLDFGTSLRTGQPAMREVLNRLPATLELGGAAFAFAILAGLPLGVLAAARRGGLLDAGARLLALVGQAVPSFWLGIVLIILFSVKVHWLPTGGRGGWKNLLMPAVTLGAFGAASIARLTRSGMIDALGSDFVRTARAKGVPPRGILVRHALPHALLPVVTILGLQVGTLVAGAIIVETVFAWPGVGRLMLQSISGDDYPVLQAGVVVTAVTIVLANATVDLLYSRIDPRLREYV